MKYYRAKIGDAILAIDASKRNVTAYIEVIRKLKYGYYTLEQLDSPSFDIVADANPRACMVEVISGIIVPARDADYITTTVQKFSEFLGDNYKFLTDFYTLSLVNDPQYASIFKNTLETMKTIIDSPKHMKNYLRALALNSKVLRMPIEEYLEWMKIDKELYNMKKKWEYLVHNDD